MIEDNKCTNKEKKEVEFEFASKEDIKNAWELTKKRYSKALEKLGK